MAGVFLTLLSLALSLPALASVRTISESGRPIYWPNPNITFYANPQNSSGLSSGDISSLLSAALGSWEGPHNRARIQYGQSANYPAVSDYDGYNSIYFASHAHRILDPQVVALTEVLYFVNSGQIAEADMVFNDNDYKFTRFEGDTGYQDANNNHLIYLRDVATHEAGHALGLDHSNVNLSSLFYTAFTGQYALGNDDKNILTATYPSASAPTGSLSGTVRGANGGIFGAQVSAINLATGKIEAAALANPDGTFRLNNLPDASYAVFMEPFMTSTGTIASYFRNMDHHFCGAHQQNYFKRGFYGPCGSTKAAVVGIAGGNSVNLNTLAPSCSVMSSELPNNLLANAYVLSGPGSVHGVLGNNQFHYYRLNGVNGRLKARALSYSLFSPSDVRVEFFNTLGASYFAGVDDIEDPKAGGGKHYDSSAELDFTGQDVIVRVSMHGEISDEEYPGGWQLKDDNGFYLLSLSIDNDFGAEAPISMAECAGVPNVQQNAYFKDSPSSPSKGGGCGTLGGPGAGGEGPGGGLTLLLASALLLQGYSFAKRHPRFRLKLVRKRR